MGSFNVTCALSGLPITDGTPVRAVVLFRPNIEAEHGFIYPSSFFTPASLPMRGVYSGYGGVKKLETGPLARAALATFFDGMDSEAAAEQAVDGLRFKPANATITRYGRAVDGKAHLALIREDFFEIACRLDIDQKKSDLSRTAPLLDDKSIAKDLGAIAERENQLRTKAQGGGELAEILAYALQRRDPLNLKTPLAYIQNDQEGELTAACFEPVRNFLAATLAKDGITPELISETRDLAALSNISMLLMRGLGKTWTPAMRMIGGSTPYRLQEVFAREVGHIATAERRWQQAARRAEEKGEKAPPRPAAKPR